MLNWIEYAQFSQLSSDLGVSFELITLIMEQNFKPDLLIIDDNSPDGTYNKVQQMQKKFKNLFLIKRNGKLGLDTAHKLAYQIAIEKKYDYLITMDADLSHDPKELMNFMSNLENYPFVIGSRYVSGGKCLMKGSRLIMSKFGNSMIKFFSRINCRRIKVDGNKFSIEGDLINNTIKVVKDDKENLKIFKNFDIKNTFRSLHLELMSQKLKHSCTIFEGLEVMKLIDKIKVKKYD